MLLEALDLEDCLIYPLSYRVLGLFWPLTFFEGSDPDIYFIYSDLMSPYIGPKTRHSLG